MSLESVTTAIRDKVHRVGRIDATIKLDLGESRTIHIDGFTDPGTVTNDDGEAQCTVKVALEDLEAILSGQLSPMSAFSLGKLALEGDMAVAFKLTEVF